MMMMMLVIITLMLFPILSLWMARIRFDSFLSSKRQTVENILIIQRFLTSCPAMTPECPPRLEKWVPILTFFTHSVDPSSLRPVAHPHRRALTIFLFLNQVPFLNLTASTPWRSLYYMVSMCQCLRLNCGYISLESLHP